MVDAGADSLERIRQDIETFAAHEGRRPRLLVVKLGQDRHGGGAKLLATAFADIGFDVDIGPPSQTPEEAARQAIENDVHVVGISTDTAGHETLMPALVRALKDQGSPETLVVVSGVIPAKEQDSLRKAGVAAIYGPDTDIPKAAAEILGILENRRAAA